MIYVSAEQIRSRAETFVRELGPIRDCKIEVIEGQSIIGGGTAPTATLPSFVVAIFCARSSVEELLTKLRKQSPPVIARIEADRLVVDLRTVFAADEQALASGIRAAFDVAAT
jgi:L-seryl-tRNA(Ser) seleniumtransferase